MNEPAVEHVERGQAGLSVGYHLARRGLPFLIVDANERVGDLGGQPSRDDCPRTWDLMPLQPGGRPPTLGR